MFLFLNDSMSLARLSRAACAQNSPFNCWSRTWAGTKADLHHTCGIHAVWGRSCLPSKTSMANEKMYEWPILCKTSNALKSSVDFQI